MEEGELNLQDEGDQEFLDIMLQQNGDYLSALNLVDKANEQMIENLKNYGLNSQFEIAKEQFKEMHKLKRN